VINIERIYIVGFLIGKALDWTFWQMRRGVKDYNNFEL
jgi:hypothetical protein